MIVLAIPLFFLELYLSLKVGENIGFLLSALWIILSAVLGGFLLKMTPYVIFQNLGAFGQGGLGGLKKLEKMGAAYFASAVLLVIPGVLTDFLALGLLVYVLYLRLFVKIPHSKDKKGDDDVIDVEIIE